MVLSLVNKDKVSAGTWSFKTVLREESGVIPIVYSKASYLLQHIQKKMSQRLCPARWWKSSCAGNSRLILGMH